MGGKQACQGCAEATKRITALLDIVGGQGKCKGCGAKVWWVVTKHGKRMPISDSGISHFVDCPESERFRRNGR